MPSKPTVLVIEDHAGSRRLVTLALRELSQASRFKIEEAANGPAGLERIERAIRGAEPLFVLCDQDMPQLPGLGILERVARRSKAPFRFVLMLLEEAPETERRAFELGADDVFVRTFDFSTWEQGLGGRLERWITACQRQPILQPAP